MLQIPALPLSDASFVFAVLMAVVLVVPLASERLRIPGIVGLVVAGMVVGPNVLGLVEREGAVAMLGSVGLLYLMFVAGLELDLNEFAANRIHSLVFGVLTFAYPMAIGVAAISLMGYDLLAATLLASCWASHTLLTYPVFRRLGTYRNRSVAASVGATILTDTAALLVLAVVVRAYGGVLDLPFWVGLFVSLGVLLAATLWALPRLARWFFAGIGQDRLVRFLFVLVALFAASALAQLAGIEPIIGAFLAGLSLNRLVPNGGQLMDRVEFLGSSFLIPLFLVSVGMIIDPRMMAQPRTLLVASAFIAIALGGKLLAAWTAGTLSGFDRVEIGTMFSLSGAQAAATLAAVIVGLDVGLIDVDTVNAVIIVILVTCVVTSWTASRYAALLPHPLPKESLGGSVVVPIARPESALPLVRLAAALARPDGGVLVPLTIAPPEADPARLSAVRTRAAEAETMALAQGIEAHSIMRIDVSPAEGMLHTVVEQSATLLVLGWKGHTAPREVLFGSIIDRVVAESPVPLLLIRTSDRIYRRVLLLVSEPNTTPSGEAALRLAVETTRRVVAGGGSGMRARVVSTVDGPLLRDLVRQRLKATLEVDPRRRTVLARDLATPEDLVIVPVRPEPAGLPPAASRIARAVPQGTVVIAYDARGAAPGAGTAGTSRLGMTPGH